jgi:hypothetical protein
VGVSREGLSLSSAGMAQWMPWMIEINSSC